MSHVQQVMLSGPKKFCSATMGGRCNYDNNGICKRCKEPKDAPVATDNDNNDGEQAQFAMAMPAASSGHFVEQRMIFGPSKFCTGTKGGVCQYPNDDENQPCIRCGKTREEFLAEPDYQVAYQAQPPVFAQQIMKSGPKDWCPSTMGGSHNYDESGVCSMCGKQK